MNEQHDPAIRRPLEEAAVIRAHWAAEHPGAPAPRIQLGRGGRGPDPAIPRCPLCYAYGGGGHGGLCPNMDVPPEQWTAALPDDYLPPDADLGQLIARETGRSIGRGLDVMAAALGGNGSSSGGDAVGGGGGSNAPLIGSIGGGGASSFGDVVTATGGPGAARRCRNCGGPMPGPDVGNWGPYCSGACEMEDEARQ